MAIKPQGSPLVNEIIVHGFVLLYSIMILPKAFDPSVMNLATDLPLQKILPSGEKCSADILQKYLSKRLVNPSYIPVSVITSEVRYHVVYDHCTVEYSIKPV